MTRKNAKPPKSTPERAEFLQKAWEARRQAIAPFSGFSVGCALRSGNNKIYTGCNIENATFGLTMCAERVALFKALSEGERHFTELFLVASGKKITPPCGSCRQLLWEFCGDIPIYMENEDGQTRQALLSELFPSPFEESFLEK